MEQRQEAAINGRRSQNSERVRAHLYEREFQPKPVICANGARERGRDRRLNRAAHSTASRTRAVPPDERNMRRGRERPLELDHGAKKGVAEGVAHAPDACSLLLTPAPRGIWAAQGAAWRSAAKSLTVREIGKSPCDKEVILSRHSRASRARGTGERCSRVCVPLSFSSLS